MSKSDYRVTESDVWVFTLRGIFAILFGLVAVFWPGLTLLTFVYLFSAYILVVGLIGLVSSIGNLYDQSRTALSRLMLGLLSVAEIGVGVYLLRHPLVSLSTFALLVGLVFIARGVLEIVSSFFDEVPAPLRLVLIFVGILTGLAGIVILMYPVSSGVAFVWVLGLYALITGPLMIVLGISARHQLRESNK